MINIQFISKTSEEITFQRINALFKIWDGRIVTAHKSVVKTGYTQGRKQGTANKLCTCRQKIKLLIKGYPSISKVELLTKGYHSMLFQ